MSRVSSAPPYAAITDSIAPRGSGTAGAAALGAVSRAARARASRSVSFHNDVTATIRIIASDSRPAVANESAPRSIVSPCASSAAVAPAPTPARTEHVEVEPDQETLDRVLAEELAKGTDRRVAEGRAKAAAIRAARKKAAE